MKKNKVLPGKVLLEGKSFAVTNSSSVSLDGITSWGWSCDVEVSSTVSPEPPAVSCIVVAVDDPVTAARSEGAISNPAIQILDNKDCLLLKLI